MSCSSKGAVVWLINLKLVNHRVIFSTDFISFIPLEPRGCHLVSLKTQSLRMPKLKFERDFDRAENSSPVCETGLEMKASSCNRKRLFNCKKVCSVSWFHSFENQNKTSRKGATGIEAVTSRSAVECSTTELCPQWRSNRWPRTMSEVKQLSAIVTANGGK